MDFGFLVQAQDAFLDQCLLLSSSGIERPENCVATFRRNHFGVDPNGCSLPFSCYPVGRPELRMDLC